MLPTVNAQNSPNTQGVVATPDSLDAMRHRLAAEHHALSPRLQDVGTYVAAHPQSIAVDTLAQIAERAGSHPSTLVRFARYFGFTGFSELQQLYKQHVHDHFAAVDYGTRIRNRQPGHNDSAVTPAGLLNEFTDANLLSLERLRAEIDTDTLNRAVELLDQATRIHVCGIRRAFPVAMYTSYALSLMGVDCRAIDGLGMMQASQMNAIVDGDVLLAITFRPYADEVQDIISAAHRDGARIVLLTDQLAAPGADKANVIFSVQDAEVRSFRSLNASMCLAQTLCIALGYRREADSPSST
jgi:DNA-binding MurR/RpiR family transcriptional regulator